MMQLIVTGLILAIFSLALLNTAVYADDGQGKQGNTFDVGVSGDVRVDISASGPVQLQVKASGPATVSVCTGKECLLQVEAEAPAEVNINKNCDPALNLYKPNNGLEIIPGVLWVQGLSFFNKSSDKRAGLLVVYLLGSRYEL